MSTRRATELLYDSEATLRLVDNALEELRDFPSDRDALPADAELGPEVDAAAAAPLARAEVLLRAHAELSTTVERLRQSRIMLESAASRRGAEERHGVATGEGHATSVVLHGLDQALLVLDRLDEDDAERGATLRRALRHQLHACMSQVQLEDITAQQLRHASKLMGGMENRLARIAAMLDPERRGAPDPPRVAAR